ncbi:TetR family transcriptional regulator [Mycobacteroides abscessus subsp. bolletii]|nr:TetR/AcrR family transcriptional regulator [Mycobacteroides abscessus]SHZ21928.1 TetR family transcriptional regulator [Mycobacteroides abscessus subsp. bolletii]SHO90886.1 TetR family transcriptional regulator [Mycobacteroides abscessus subsp. abscessus]SIE26810.1 TetR family transcriptional regulator [Mycobacteroides abscessus subsp. abscessus]SII00145.1 TetR family transcriptional regulator [Mycobacteroides abscessus subsp. abscessus]SKF71658.1 TetR family transcriptional regulator [Myco
MTRRTVGRFRSVDTDGSAALGIFSAAERLLEQTAFSDISVAQILDEAKVSRATFYFYFSSKFSVLAGLLTRAMDDIFETVQPFLARSAEDSPEEALERSIRAVASAWHRHRAVLKAVNHHWQSDAELRELWLGIVERFVAAGADEIERERAVGKITAPETGRTLASLLFWSTERVLYIAGQGIEPAWSDEEAAVGPLVKLWHSTLYG